MIARIAIINKNTLEATGLKSIICDIVPKVNVSAYISVKAMLHEQNEEVPFVHFFVSSQNLVAEPDFFLAHPRQTIVLTSGALKNPLFSHFKTLNTSIAEHELVKALLSLHQHAHGSAPHSGFHHGFVPEDEVMSPAMEISPRETEVLALVARGLMNKEIAEQLCISLPTVISHRKNICEKLNLRSVSSLTIYAVTHGIVSVDDI